MVVILKIKRIKMCSEVDDCYDIIYMYSQTCRVGEGHTVCVWGGGVKEKKWGTCCLDKYVLICINLLQVCKDTTFRGV